MYRGLNPTAAVADRGECRGGDDLYGFGRDGAACGSAGSELRSREFLLAAGTAAGSGRDSVHSATTIGNSTLGMLANDFAGAVVRITRGTGATQERAVVANTATTLTVTPAWTVTPDSTSYFVVADSTWNFGGLGATSPVQIEVPNRGGRDGGDFGAIGECAGSRKPVGTESADAVADRRSGGRRRGHGRSAAAGVRA